MGFAMRVNFVDVVCDNSLKNDYVDGKKSGYSFDVRLSYYRGHFLSDIDKLEIYVDGSKVPEKDVCFCLNQKKFFVSQLQECYTEFWRLLDEAHIEIDKRGGLEVGKHEVKVIMIMRVPYLPLPNSDSDHAYMPLDCCGEKVLEIREVSINE